MLSGAVGVLAIWHDVVDGSDREIADWYDREHHLERLAIKGFLSARRYKSMDPRSPMFFNRYETVNLDVFQSDAYVRCLNCPTEWSRRCQPLFRNMSRSTCRIVARAGQAEGGFACTFRIPPTSSRNLTEAGFGSVIRRYQDCWGLVGFELWHSDTTTSNIQSAERSLRGRHDDVISGALIVHATTSDALEEIAAELQRDLAEEVGVEIPGEAYALMFSAHSVT
jgi:hypothetical protein